MLDSFSSTALEKLQENPREPIGANILMEGQVTILRAELKQFYGQKDSLRISGLQDSQDATTAVTTLLDISLDLIC